MILENIARRCKEKGINFADLEHACGLGKNAIYKWSTSQPAVQKVKAVADYLGCTVDDLLREEE